MRQPNFYSAVYAIIKNEKWEILFQKRQNTWFKDWYYQLPSWHIEWGEFIKKSCIREMKEELNIDILEEDLKLLHVLHRVTKDRVYIDFYLEVLKYSWELRNNELEKCSEIKFFDINNLWEKDFVMFDIESIKKSKSWIFFSEINM